MIDETAKDQLAAEFRAWLDTREEDPVAEWEDDGEDPDLFTFYGELAALRQELGMQTRGVHRSTQETTATLASLKESLTGQSAALEAAAREIKAQLPQARSQGEDGVLLELIRLREAFAENAAWFGEQKLRGFFPAKADREMLRKQQRQQELLMKKTDDVLRRFDVSPVAREGEPFDAASMRALAATESAAAPPGCVTRIYTQGFRRNQKLLSTAEVEVRKSS